MNDLKEETKKFLNTAYELARDDNYQHFDIIARMRECVDEIDRDGVILRKDIYDEGWRVGYKEGEKAGNIDQAKANNEKAKIEMSMMNKEKEVIALSFGSDQEVSTTVILTKKDIKRVEELFSLAGMSKK